MDERDEWGEVSTGRREDIVDCKIKYVLGTYERGEGEASRVSHTAELKPYFTRIHFADNVAES